MGYQFVHAETYARKADKGGRSTSFVFDEADRKPGASEHVKHPVKPEVVHGLSVEAVRQLHDEMVEEARVTDSKGKAKKLRVDQHTLMTVIASHPAFMGEVDEKPEVAEAVAEWERKTVDWLRDKYGDRLVSVVRHVDEDHPHLHAYVLPDGPMRARDLHDGVVAKREAKERALAEGMDGKAANKIGDAAYKQAMRDFQDDYWNQVGVPCGLARLGPGRRRLTRGEWQTERAAAAKTGELVRTAEQAQAVLEASAEAKAEAAQLEERAREVARRAKAMVAEARDRAAAAKAAADAADAKRLAAEREAAAVKARAEAEAQKVVARAKRQATKMLGAAEAAAGRMRGLGSRVGSLLGGVKNAPLFSSPDKIAERAREEERARLQPAIDKEREEKLDAWSELKKLETDNTNLRSSVNNMSKKNDDLARQVEALSARRKPGGESAGWKPK